MRPTLRQLEYITAVARLGRFNLAAEALNVSQPSLSAQIAEVERDLGVRLFERSRSGVQLTGKGAEVVRRAQGILRAVEDLRASVAGEVPFGGRLRLGVLPSIGPWLLPRVVAHVHQNFPNLRVVVREEPTQDLEQGLRSGRFDRIISTPEDHPGTLQQTLFSEHLYILVARDDPLARGSGAVDPAELRGRIFLTLDARHRLARMVYALASDCGGMISDEYEGTSLDSILMMAASGAGVAIVPQLYAGRQAVHDPEVVVRPLGLPSARREIALIRNGSERSPNSDGDLLFLALRDEARRLGLGS
ncbi:hydrogen peroxide-inducible genes activator [Jhaorihella thermophila]|uniref:LysR family transcriptional regulator, hydrogen peroxide-inducible genes activator n=1 Tax=Jhaorihella thermophila TaxID=488547 RepID=A0A1H5YU93_9RHOB|nr:hydrogen peroxide-inducible genes activator [Jhaorihella thermophila]SEG27783.1 LysR family transcriptional regulator, hydrogen peroxide-inducible genes activator [Jhaorihella thermophila]